MDYFAFIRHVECEQICAAIALLYVYNTNHCYQRDYHCGHAFLLLYIKG
uniref:Uncharacterized protein n=1 Tax=Anguilla anguilla TaxID=7936 RepID=A0A0E9TQZ8_ANGAN